MAERGEFELPVPICEQSDDSIGLRFATWTSRKALSPRGAFLVRFRIAAERRSKMACPPIRSLLRHQSRCRSSGMRERYLRECC